VKSWSLSESVSRSAGTRWLVLDGVSAEPGMGLGLGSSVVASRVSSMGSTDTRL